MRGDDSERLQTFVLTACYCDQTDDDVITLWLRHL